MGRNVISKNKSWFRAIGAALTLAGSAVVFIVLFLPTSASARTAYCNLEAGGGHRAASISGFSTTTDKPAVAAGDTSSADSHWLAIFMTDANHVNDVWFPAVKGQGDNINGKASRWVGVGSATPGDSGSGGPNDDQFTSTVYTDSGANTVWVEIPTYGVTKGKIRVNNSSDPNFCYVQSQKTFNPN
jgi:hypothetical protein